MANAKQAFEVNDRVKRGDERGTVIYFHKDKMRISVLPDDRPRSRGSAVWECSEVVKIGVLGRTCPVCGQAHLVYYCPERI
jgi:hypothetical protein